jgi:adenine-specific DNA-methyltransferase
MSPSEVRLALRLYSESGWNAAEVVRRLQESGVGASARTIERALKRALREGVPRETAPRRPPPDGQVVLDWAGRSELPAYPSTAHAPRFVRVAGTGKFLVSDRHHLLAADNLVALRALRAQEVRAQLVYLDPPYGVGSDITYRDADGTAGWLSDVAPRLALVREVLADDGVLAMSISDRHLPHARLLLDEALGARRHLGTIVVETTTGSRSRSSSLGSNHEYLLLYGDKRALRGDVSRIEAVPRYFRHRDDRGVFGEYELRAVGSLRDGAKRPSMRYPLFVDPADGTVSADQTRTHRIVVHPDAGEREGRWTWSRSKVARDPALLRARQTRDGVWRVFRRVYAEASDAAHVESIWSAPEYLHRRGVEDLAAVVPGRLFAHPKPLALMRRLLAITPPRQAPHVVLDLYAGSGTLAEAVLAANDEDGGSRMYVGVQTPEPTPERSAAREAGYETIDQITRARIEAAARARRPGWRAKLSVWRVGR